MAVDFKDVKTGKNYRNTELGVGTDHYPTASPEEVHERRKYMKTQGKKGAHAIKRTMAITPDNDEYVRTMAAIKGWSVTYYINYVLEQYRLEHGDAYKRAKKIADKERPIEGGDLGHKDE